MSIAGPVEGHAGLFDELGTLNGNPRPEFYEIFRNNTGSTVHVTGVTLYGNVLSTCTAVFVPVIPGNSREASGILVPDTDPEHWLASAPLAPFFGESGPFFVPFDQGLDIPPGEIVAFGVLAPLEKDVDAILLGTDQLPNQLTTTEPPYWNGFYIFADGGWELAIANHYLVIEGVRK